LAEQEFFFFIGTNAELIKTMPVIRNFLGRGMRVRLIATGQNYPLEDELLELAGIDTIDLQLSSRPIPQHPLSLLRWFIATFLKGLVMMRRYVRTLDPQAGRVMIVHGDTISTVMGGVFGRLYGFKVVHLEAGLRSGNLLRPFPEEINRNITSLLADVDFCPNENAIGNIKRARAVKVNTGFNSLIESIGVALEHSKSPKVVTDIVDGGKFFILVVHRQENIYNRQFLTDVVDKVTGLEPGMRCVFVLHEPTEKALKSCGLLDALTHCDNIIALERQDFVDFIQLMSHCEFLITDGGSNQQEASYLGIPCLVLRTETESPEGLGENALLFGGDITSIDRFIAEHEKYRRPRIVPERKPSDIIVETLVEQ
jgi:UDP-N-acetylglucosamine 2-epimerase (non-hydrolysing)